ncbi:hypothetical protein [Flammeovirga aprica]|uniref:Uncharacterized protein n=1 Tax=Flammeovirga aprica JL-4 TaxID=694437 RepID=A0A7X9S218_9BACT|nr:hypothetical protein [Flammeovirga aprica]NME72961.1 hypothetical protein [Flammeovirga aprica JL-4]
MLKNLHEKRLSILDESQYVTEVMDPIHDFLREKVGRAIILLNNSRILIRKGSQKDLKSGLNEYEEFKLLWLKLTLDIGFLKEKLPKDKSILAIEELLDKSVNRKLQSKIPLPAKSYLNDLKVDVSDIDWIIKKIKDYSGKYSQVYTSTRINYLLKIKK